MTKDKKGESYKNVETKAPDPQPNGVIVIVEGGDPNTEATIKVQTLGTTQALEAPTLLRLAAREAEKQFGL